MQEMRDTGQMLKEWLPQACVFVLYTSKKMDMDIRSDSSSSEKDTATAAYWDSNVGLPFRSVSEEEFWQS